ncbi:MAG: adenine deaminase [Dehalococcoidia bacterium]|jgi:adenine deaminase|nr:adenine deaminase [Dehalococcoidia bacterium]
MMEDYLAHMPQIMAAARGEIPGDLLLRNARIVNVFTSEVEEGDVLIKEGYIAAVGREEYGAQEVVDLGGAYLLPGFIDGHVHLESSYLYVDQYARAVVPRGTTAVVTDLHELANVAGLRGLRRYLRDARPLPLDVFLMVPSCVPATFDLETSGAVLGPREIRRALRWPEAIGLGELMNFPGVIHGHRACLDKVEAAWGSVLDGHAPKVRGKDLNAYLCAGPRSDHETTQLEEGWEKVRRGMYLMIREGTTEKNLEELLPLVSDDTYPRCMLVVDDRSCRDLLQDGDIDAVVRKAVRLGLRPIRAVQMVTIVPATHFRLRHHGAVAPGYVANLLVADDLYDLRPRQVYYRGQLVAQDGHPLFQGVRRIPRWLTRTVRPAPITAAAFRLRARPGPLPVIEIVPRQIITRRVEAELPRDAEGHVLPDLQQDIVKLAVVERHKGTGNVGVGMVKGFGLQRGAIASSFAHDSHNIVIVGVSDDDMLLACQEIWRMQGGLVAVEGGRVLASLPLPIAGLMSPRPLEEVARGLEEVEKAAQHLGVRVPAPYAILSFLALPVIPDLRVTDRGLVDVVAARVVDLAA